MVAATMSAPSESSWGPERGIAPLYDCPECPYSRTGATTSRHGFKLHLLKEHGYDDSDIDQVLDSST